MNTAFAQGGHYTVFAPTNDAFNNTERLHMQDVLNNIKRMTGILTDHLTRHFLNVQVYNN